MLLCSDGITSELGDDDIAAALGRPDPAQRVAENLTDLALRAGGRDNITCIVVDALPLGDPAGAAGDGDRDETRPRHRPDSLGVGR
jgi:protein phosphatase